MAYMDFLRYCYIDTEVEERETYTSTNLWVLFDNVLLDMARVSVFRLQSLLSLKCLLGITQRSR